MAEEGTLCNNADVLKKAGANANSTATAEAYTNVFIKEAEGYICAITGYDWKTNYATLSTVGKELLRDIASSLAAIKAINYDMSGFTSRTEAQTMIDVNYSMAVDGLNVIIEDRGRSFVNNA